MNFYGNIYGYIRQVLRKIIAGLLESDEILQKWSNFSYVFFYFWISDVWRQENAIVPIIVRKQFSKKKSHMKKLIDFQHFGNISTDSKSPVFFLSGLIYPYILTKNSKVNKTSNFFEDFWCRK